MSEDVEEAGRQQMTTRSGRSFGVGPVGNSGGLLPISGTCPSASAAHLASSPSVESHETQLGSEVGLTATTTTESTVPTVARQMDSPVSSIPPSSAPREAESNIITLFQQPTVKGHSHCAPYGAARRCTAPCPRR